MPNPSTYFAGRFSLLAPAACATVATPTFAGISGLSRNGDGSLTASWAAGTTSAPPLRYEVYIQAGTATGLFALGNIVDIATGTSKRIFTDAAGLILQVGQTYFVGVRAVDAVSNRETNTVSMSLAISNINYNTLAGAVWDQLESAHTTAGTFGADVQEISADTDEILTATTEIAADTDTILTQTAASAIAAAVWNAASASYNTAGSFGANLQNAVSTTNAIATAVWGALRASNTVSGSFGEALQGVFSTTRASDIDLIPLIKAVTDKFLFDGSNFVKANVQVNSDKTGYSLTLAEEQAIAVAVWAAQQSANTAAGSFGAALQGNIGSQVFLLQLASVALTQYNALISAIQNIQNSTNFVGIVPAQMDIPASGTNTYTFYATVFNSSGGLVDPDSQILHFTVKDNNGNVLQAQQSMTRDALGQYHGTFPVASTATETSVVVFFNYSVASVAFQQTRTSEITAVDPDSANILAIKAKTDQLTFTGSNVNANAQVVSDKTGYALTVAQHTQISADVWDALLSSHATAGTFGFNAQNAVQTGAQIAADVWDALTSAHTVSGSFGAALGPINAAFIASAVWNALLTSYNTSGTFGGNAQTPSITPSQVATAVWDALTSAHTVSGSFGNNLQLAVMSAAQVASAVWNALLSTYNAPGSFGANAQNPPLNPTQIAQAVWNALIGSYATSGTFGAQLQNPVLSAAGTAAAVLDGPITSHNTPGTVGGAIASGGGGGGGGGLGPIGIVAPDTSEIIGPITGIVAPSSGPIVGIVEE